MKTWKRVTASVLCAVLFMQAMPQKSIAAEEGSIEEEVQAAAKFSIAYKDGSFVKAPEGILEAEIGAIDYEEELSETPETIPAQIKKVIVTGAGGHFARQSNPKEVEIETEIFTAEEEEKIEQVSFLCPEAGIGTLEIEMVMDTAKPKVKVNGQETAEEMPAVLATRSNTEFAIRIEAADNESGIKKVEWCEEDKEYGELFTLSPVEAGEDGNWSYEGMAGQTKNLYFWVSDYYGNRTRAEVLIEVDDKAPEINRESIQVSGLQEITDHEIHYWGEVENPALELEVTEDHGAVTAVYSIYNKEEWGNYEKVGEGHNVELMPKEDGSARQILPLDAAAISGLENGSYKIEALFTDALMNTTDPWNPVQLYEFKINKTMLNIVLKGGAAEAELKGICTAFAGDNAITKEFELKNSEVSNIAILNPGEIQIIFEDMNGLLVSGIHLNGIDISSCYKEGILNLNEEVMKGIGNSGTLELTADYTKKFTVQYQDGSFLPFSKTILNPNIGTAEIKGDALEVSGEKDYFARQYESETEEKAESETVAEDTSNKVDKMIFTCPSTGEGTLTIEMVTDQTEPEIVLEGTGIVGNKVFADKNDNVEIIVNALDKESGIKKVEYSTVSEEYDGNDIYDVENKEGKWYYNKDVVKPGNLYFWASDYYNHRTRAAIEVIIDHEPPVIDTSNLTVVGTDSIDGKDGNHYWKKSDNYGLKFKAEDANAPITAVYTITNIGTGEIIKNGENKEFTVTLSEADENQMRTLSLDEKVINSLSEGTYRISADFSDLAKNQTELAEDFYTFTLNQQSPTVKPKDSASQLWLKVSDEPKAVKDIAASIETGQPIDQMSYAITDTVKDGKAEAPKADADDWIEVPSQNIQVGEKDAKADITYQLPIGTQQDGTVTYHLWVKDALDHTSVSSITCHFDGGVPEFSNFKAELKSENPILHVFQYIFGTVLKEEETLLLTVDAKDNYDSAKYTENPEIVQVELYYMEENCNTPDDKELGAEDNEASYEALEKTKASVQKIKAQDAGSQKEDGTGTYQFRLNVNKNNRFYKLYFVATDKAGNRKILNAASLTKGKNSAFVMVDDKKPCIVNQLQTSCAQADYEAMDGKQSMRWYRGDRTIRYDLSVTDKESGVFSIGASLNGTAITKDARGKILYDSSTAEDASSLKLEKEFSYVINPKQEAIAADGGCQVQIRAEDNAGNTKKISDQIYIDRDAPVILEMEFDTGEKDKLNTIPAQYGYFFQKKTKVTVYATDYIGDSKVTGSGISNIVYQLLPADGSEVISKELSVKESKDGICKAVFTIPEGFKGQIEVKATDHVGQSKGFYNPRGAVVETAKEHSTTSEAEIILPQTSYEDSEGNPLYDSSINVKLETADNRSGLKQNTWAVREYNAQENLAGGTLSIASVYNEEQKTWRSTLSGDTDWKIPSGLELNLVTQAKREQNIVSDTNHISAVLGIADNAGNTSAARPKVFSIDQTAPVIDVSYDNNEVENEKYYKEARTATVTVTDGNFSPEDCKFDITGPENNITSWRHQPGIGCDGTVHTSSCSYRCQVKFAQDGDYTFGFQCKDLAGHTAAYGKVDEFTIDKVKPVIRVSYDNNASAGGGYYQEVRKATIEVEDKNFNSADTQIEVSAQKDGAVIGTPSVSSFTQNGDIWTASVSYGEDGDYTFSVATTDQAGNAAEEYAREEFTIDQTVPELTIEGVVENSANKGTVAPIIRTKDINLDGASLTVTLTGANHGQVFYESQRQQTDQTAEISMSDFKHVEEVDDLYTLEVAVSDRAGNETKQSRVFSVNRFGSVYLLEDTTEQLVDQFYIKQEQDVVITEVNVDTLQFGEISYSLDGNIITLEKGKDYDVESQTDQSSWKMYKYRIKAENFVQEGSYVVSLYSEDLAQNRSSNKAKGKEVSFVVDKTSPTIVVAGVEDNGQYVDVNRNITVDTQDNILLDSVGVYTNDERKTAAGRDELLKNNGQVTLALAGSNQQQKLYVEAKDAAGNVTRSRDICFLITKNMLVQWYSNLPLCVGSIGGTAAVGVAGVTIFRRKKLRIRRG